MNRNPASRYLQLAQNRGGYRNADGFFDRDTMSGSRGYYADATAAVPAASTAVVNNKPTSQPFVINVTSTSGAAVSNFDILGAYQYVTNPPAGFSWSNGNLVNGSITISSGVSGITYAQMLAQFQGLPFTVGNTYIKSTTAGQIDETLTLSISDATGRSGNNPMIPLIDPYQMQSTVIVFNQKYRMDGNTKITIATVLANATVTFYLFPIDDYNPVRALSDGQIVKSFSNPNLVRAQQVFIGSPNQ